MSELATMGISKGLGGLGGGVSNMYDQAGVRRSANARIKGAQQLQSEIAANEQLRTGQANQAYAPLLEGFSGNLSDLSEMIKGTDLGSYLPEEQGDFSFDRDAEIAGYKQRNQDDLQAIIDRSLGGIKAEGAASGSLFSGATGRNIARSAADIGAQANKEAEQFAQNAEPNKYQKFIDKWANQMQLANAKVNAAQSNIQNRSNLFNTQSNLFGAQRSEVTGIQNASDTARFGSRAEEEAARAEKAGTSSGGSAFFQGFAKGLM